MPERPLRRALPVALAVAAAAGLAALAGAGPGRAPTFCREVARVLQRHCQSCHHDGDIAPFPLVTYADALEQATAIRDEAAAGRMPPWKPDPGFGLYHGVRRLDAGEIELLARWADAGAPEGDPADLPPPLEFPDGWVLGTPDAVLASPAPYTVGGVEEEYRCFPIPTSFGEDRWIRAVDVRPGDRSVVHHVLLYLDASGTSALLDAADPGPGYSCFGGPGGGSTAILGGWAPGGRPEPLPSSVGLRLPAGVTVVMQVHYHPDGAPVQDTTQVGLYFHPSTPAREMFVVPVGNVAFTIPAGETAHEVTGELTAPGFLGFTVYTVTPHMHLLGRTIRADALFPDGTERSLVRISDWDFDWQGTYAFLDPVAIPGGTTVRVRAVYDNSAGNPSNPSDPPVPVSYGEATTDEMCFAFLGVSLGLPDRVPPAPRVRSVRVDSRGRLVVRARGAARGARIEIDGAPAADTRGRGTLRSEEDGPAAAPVGVGVEVRVRNPDGLLSLPVAFQR